MVLSPKFNSNYKFKIELLGDILEQVDPQKSLIERHYRKKFEKQSTTLELNTTSNRAPL